MKRARGENTRDINLSTVLTVTEADLDTLAGSGTALVFRIMDDIPVLTDAAESAAVDEDDLNTAYSQGSDQSQPASTSGSLAALVSVGTDEMAGGGAGFKLKSDTSVLPALSSKGDLISYAVNPAGTLLTGYVDLPRLLQGMRAWLDTQGCLVERELPSAQIECSARGVHADGLQAQRLIFCEGARLRFNRWFGDLPLAPDKGEILDLQIADWRTRHIINGAYWLVPLDNGEVRLGATHEHRQLDDRPTDVARQLLLAGLAELLPAAVTSRVVRQQTGIRPATSDRYPLIGAHPEFPNLWVFNGFGAHGALRTPWYAQRLTAHLQSAEPLPAEADIRRFR